MDAPDGWGQRAVLQMLTGPVVSRCCRTQDYGPMVHMNFKKELCKFHLKSCTCVGKLSRWDFYGHLQYF